jgi:hypothetical protein
MKGDLYRLYENICAYTGEWFPELSASVDHFIPTSTNPQLAYEWSNYRLTTNKMNNDKRNKIDIVDPFKVQFGWFVLDFPSCQITPGKNLDKTERLKIGKTINVLKLNSNDRKNNRFAIIQDYINNIFPLDFLRKRYPYIAYELDRQGPKEKIADYFKPLKLKISSQLNPDERA